MRYEPAIKDPEKEKKIEELKKQTDAALNGPHVRFNPNPLGMRNEPIKDPLMEMLYNRDTRPIKELTPEERKRAAMEYELGLQA
jgi:hypothetical protein